MSRIYELQNWTMMSSSSRSSGLDRNDSTQWKNVRQRIGRCCIEDDLSNVFTITVEETCESNYASTISIIVSMIPIQYRVYVEKRHPTTVYSICIHRSVGRIRVNNLSRWRPWTILVILSLRRCHRKIRRRPSSIIQSLSINRDKRDDALMSEFI